MDDGVDEENEGSEEEYQIGEDRDTVHTVLFKWHPVDQEAKDHNLRPYYKQGDAEAQIHETRQDVEDHQNFPYDHKNGDDPGGVGLPFAPGDHEIQIPVHFFSFAVDGESRDEVGREPDSDAAEDYSLEYLVHYNMPVVDEYGPFDVSFGEIDVQLHVQAVEEEVDVRLVEYSEQEFPRYEISTDICVDYPDYVPLVHEPLRELHEEAEDEAQDQVVDVDLRDVGSIQDEVARLVVLHEVLPMGDEVVVLSVNGVTHFLDRVIIQNMVIFEIEEIAHEEALDPPVEPVE